MPSSVLLLSNNAPLGLKVLYCLGAAGIDVDILSIADGNYCRYSRYRRSFAAVTGPHDAEHRERILAWIRARQAARGWHAVLADDVNAHALLHDIAPFLDLPAFAPTAAPVLDQLHDKWHFYLRAKAAGVLVPESWLLSQPGDIERVLAGPLPFPLLVKPLNAESGHGIVRFDAVEPLRRYLASPGPYRQFPLKLQRFVNGSTLGVSLVARDGRILAHDVQLHAQDGSRLFYRDAEALDAASRIVQAYGYGGPGHMDFVREDSSGRLYALEFNCRFWYSTTVSMWRGGNFPAKAVRIARGESVRPEPTRSGRYFQPGTVVRMALRAPSRLRSLDSPNWRGFWQALSDPLPHVATLLGR